MSEPVSRYLVAIMLRGPVVGEIEALRTEYRIPAWEPKIGLHVTLVRPFSSGLRVPELAKSIRTIALAHRPFHLSFSGFGRFDNKQSVLYARVIPERGLVNLQEDLVRTMGDILPPSDYPFTPHASISDETSSQQVDDYQQRLGNRLLHGTMLCDRFALLLKDEAAREWNVTSEFRLT